MVNLCETIIDKDLLFVPSSLLAESHSLLNQWLTRKERAHLVILQDTPFIDVSWQIGDTVEIAPLYEPLSACFFDIAKRFVFTSSMLYLPDGSEWLYAPLFKSALLHAQFIGSEMADFGYGVYDNIRHAATNSQESFNFSMLKNSLYKMPAVICGAGPSLTDQMEDLIPLFPHAAIFAGGSALTALSLSSAAPHIAAIVDPCPDHLRFLQSQGFETPLFYQYRAASDVVSAHQGAKIVAPCSEASFIERWIRLSSESQQEEIDGGWSVATFLTALSIYLGCDPIVFVGVDLDADSTYASGLLQEESDRKEKKEWQLSREWIDKAIEKTPNTRFYSASKAHLPHATKATLKEFKQQIKTPQRDIAAHIHSRIMRARIDGPDAIMVEGIEKFEKSLARTEKIIQSMLDLFSAHYPNSPTAKGEYILLEHDLSLEEVHNALLIPAWDVWCHVFSEEKSIQEHKVLHQVLFFQKIIGVYLKKEDVK